MREHPIPQDIVGYRFHIVGSMTLKQFAELAIGVILGMIIYATNLPTIIKWPLIFTAGAFGAATAFLPIEERPLDHWITTFSKILYQPTKFFWKRSSKIPNFFLFEAEKGVLEAKDEIDLTPARRKRIKEYLASVKSISKHQDKYDQDTQKRISDIMQNFKKIDPDQVEITKQIEKPGLKVRVRSLEKIQPEEEVIVYTETTQPETETLLSTTQVAKKIEVPAIEVTRTETNNSVIQEKAASANQQQTAYVASVDINNQEKLDEEGVVFNASLPFPSKPTQPNKLVGMILTTNNELIPEAIVEIKNEQNRVIRAVKSNALGQFFISTPLKSGSYNVVINHPRYQFNPQEIVLKNKLVDPIEIRSLS